MLSSGEVILLVGGGIAFDRPVGAYQVRLCLTDEEKLLHLMDQASNDESFR
jgi:hypothetical protein